MIAIKGMEEMPKNCLDCPISHADKIDYYICGKTGKNVYLYTNEIHPDCPLIEIVTCKDCASRDTRTEKDGFAYCPKKGMDTHEEYFCPKGERKNKKNMSDQENEIYETEYQLQLEWLYGSFHGSQDDDSGWDGE